MGFFKLFRIRPDDVAEPEYEAPKDKESLIDPKKRKWNLQMPLPHIMYGFIAFVAIVSPIILYVTIFSDNPDVQSAAWRCDLKPSYRIPCMKGKAGIDGSSCEKMGCCWNETIKSCFHSIPSQHSYTVDDWIDTIKAAEQLHTSYLDLKARVSKTPYQKSAVNQLRICAVSVTQSQLKLFLYDQTLHNPVIPDGIDFLNTSFHISVYGPEYFSVEISRKDDKAAVLFDTSRGPIIASENYWELALQLPLESHVFGLGELHVPVNKPKVLYNNENRTSSHPFIMILDQKGRAHGVLFNNTGPMEFELLEGSNLLIVRSLSTLHWDITIFAGPTPKDVMNQYTSNSRPVLPPKWVLGLHICRETNETTALQDLNRFINGSKDLLLPYESDCLQERFFGNLNFSLTNNMTTVLETFRNAGKKLMISLQPQVQTSLANTTDLFVLNSSNFQVVQQNFRGINVSFPDVFHNDTGIWLQEKIGWLQSEEILGGYVLQEEWPAANSTQYQMLENMSYVPEGNLSNGTLWWTMKHGNTSHYLIHNAYGLKFAEQVSSGLNSGEQIVLSSSTFTGSGSVGGSHAHSLAQVNCTWSNMAAALKIVLGLGISGIPLAGGGPVCGNYGEYDDELCLRWYQLSSLLPLIRVSSQRPLRDPVNLSAFKKSVVDSIHLRYSLLTYIYSLFLKASSTGVPVVRPMFFEFPSDNNTWTKDDHFMLGPAILVRPMLLPQQVEVQVYFPQEDIPWFHFQGGHQINNGSGGYEESITSLPTDIVILIRGGYIVPTQEQNKLTVTETLSSNFTLVVALACTGNGSCQASGDLQIEKNSTLYFNATESQVIIQGSCVNTTVRNLQRIVVYGQNSTGTAEVSVIPPTCSSLYPSAEFEEQENVLQIMNLDINLCCSESVQISWNFG